MSFENLFISHFVFYDQKVAINFHVKDLCLPFTDEPSEMQKLPSKMLRLQNWEVLDLSEKEFRDWKTDEKMTNLKGWLKEAYERQVTAGHALPISKPI